MASSRLERLLAAVSTDCESYGIQKLQLMQVRTADKVRRPDGSITENTTDLTYLTTTVSVDGHVRRELARRLSMAQRDFIEFSFVWKHSSLGRLRKNEAFDAIIGRKLLYGMVTVWLNTSERRRLDEFQNRCLRQIWSMQAAYLSRVANREVLARTAQSPFSLRLKGEQLIFYGKAARSPEGSLRRDSVFSPGQLHPATDRYVRKVWRPRLEWTTQVHKFGLGAAGSWTNLKDKTASSYI